MTRALNEREARGVRPKTDEEITTHKLAHMMAKTDEELVKFLRYSEAFGSETLTPEMQAEYEASIRAEIARRKQARS